jgi:hypothetical protein
MGCIMALCLSSEPEHFRYLLKTKRFFCRSPESLSCPDALVGAPKKLRPRDRRAARLPNGSTKRVALAPSPH